MSHCVSHACTLVYAISLKRKPPKRSVTPGDWPCSCANRLLSVDAERQHGPKVHELVLWLDPKHWQGPPAQDLDSKVPLYVNAKVGALRPNHCASWVPQGTEALHSYLHYAVWFPASCEPTKHTFSTQCCHQHRCSF